MQLLDYILQDKYIAIDLETSGLNPRKDQILSIAWYSKNKSGFLPFPQFNLLYDLVPELLDPNIAKVFHNVNFDLSFFLESNLKWVGPLVDTLLLAQLINENRELKLKVLSEAELGSDSIKHYRAIEAWRVAHKKKKGDYSEAPLELLKEYNIEDVRNTYKLANIFTCQLKVIDNNVRRVFKQVGPVTYYEEEMQKFEEALLKMNCRGIKIDIDKAKEKQRELQKQKYEAIKELQESTGEHVSRIRQEWYESILASYKTDRGRANAKYPEFNWDSTQQVGKLFFESMDLQRHYSRKTETGLWKCDELVFKEALESGDLPDLLRRACTSYLHFIKIKSKLSKIGGLKGKGLLGKLEEGRLYPIFKQVGGDEDKAKGTVTGRLSSSPNCQNQEEWEKEFYIPG